MPVYLIRAGEEGPVKIGHAKHVARRLVNLQSGSVEPLILLGTLAGAELEEQRLHQRFAEDHIRGEWFRFNYRMLDGLCPPPDPVRSGSRNRLDSWMKQHRLTQAAFAKMIGASQGAVARFVLGQRMPNKRTVEKIDEVTNGEVPPASWYNVPCRPPRVAEDAA